MPDIVEQDLSRYYDTSSPAKDLTGVHGRNLAQSPAIGKQAAAVERAAMNWRGHVNNLRDLAERGKRPQIEYEMAAQWLPDLEAAAVTIRRLASA